MQSQASAARRGIIVAHGYGIKIHVHHRHLVIEDGIGRNRQTRRLHKAATKLKRLLLIGHTGYITLDALRWLRDTGAALIHIDADGRLLTTSVVFGPGLPSLRRAQALAAGGPAGAEIARELLSAKVSGQRALLEELPGGDASVQHLESALDEIETATDLAQLLGAEAQGAVAYWQAWSALPTPFPSRDIAKLPEHWLTFGQRASLLTGGPRLATNPPNAILNYLYALLEAEATLACHAVGLDPSLGIFHTDQRDRASLALDAMEAVRPAVDAYLLALLTQRTLSPRDFVETRQGGCRMTQRLAASLAETCSAWREQIAPVVERIAHVLGDNATTPVRRLTPLTRSNAKDALNERLPNRRRRVIAGGTLELAATCRDCGESCRAGATATARRAARRAGSRTPAAAARTPDGSSPRCAPNSATPGTAAEPPNSGAPRMLRTSWLGKHGPASDPIPRSFWQRFCRGCATYPLVFSPRRRGSPSTTAR